MTGTGKGRRVMELLLVEDNPGDVDLAREALGDGTVPVSISVATDGVEAMAFLRREGAWGSAPRPDIILLDLNLPRKDGREVLAEIKSDPALLSIPVVVLTTSAADDDVRRCYALHANCFLTKPLDLHRYLAMMEAFRDFWLAQARYPAKETPA